MHGRFHTAITFGALTSTHSVLVITPTGQVLFNRMTLLTAVPQVILSGSHFSALRSGLRRLTAVGQRGAASFGELHRVSKKADKTSTHSNDKSAIPSCDAAPKYNRFAPVAFHFHKLYKQPALKSQWRESHKSEESFHKNRHGMGLTFDSRVNEVCFAVLGSKSLRYSPSFVDSVMYKQIRGFKTNRSEAKRTHIGRIEPVKMPVYDFRESLERALSGDKDVAMHTNLAKILSSKKLSEEEEQLVKISFADGFHASTDWRSMLTGFNNSRGSTLRTQAFLEGYRSHAAAARASDDFKPRGLARLNSALLKLLVIILFLGALGLILSRFVTVSVMKLMNRENFEVSPESVDVTFDDVRGLAEAKAELSNIVDFLKNPSKYTDLGAKLPNGCLLVGEPGVGKTLLAKAVAGEAGVPFFQVSGAEFDEVFVGTGAKRVRQLFQAAKAKAPCVIFIDEIDSVGSKRTSSERHPYANQTVNQLLTEMDGFVGNPGVIVLGATNKKSNLDKALLRPGRFDVEVNINVPDLNERKEILELYLPKIATDGKVDVLTVAKRTTGCTGADLQNICNHAAMKAATDGKTVVTMQHIEYAIDKVRMGPQKKRIATEQVNRCTAFHEAGHAIVKYYCKNNTSTLHKITILPRGSSLGMTHLILNETGEYQQSKADLLDQMDVAMGGRIAEELTFGVEKVTTGASSDMKAASQIAKGMVQNFGFSDKIGVRYHEEEQIISEKLKEEMDQEVASLLQESYERAKKVLQSRQKEMKLLAEALLEYEELTYDEAKVIIEGGTLHKTPYSQLHSSKPSKEGPSSGSTLINPVITNPAEL